MEAFYNFITEHYFIPFYLVVWFVSMACYRTYFDTPLKYYPIYLMYTFLTEVLGYCIMYVDGIQFFSDERYDWHNVIIYNIYSVVGTLFFYHLYWRVLKNKNHKKWVKLGALAAMIGYLVSLFFQDPLHSNLYYADMLSAYILVLIVGLYFKEKKKENNPLPMKHNLMFWMSLGLVIFYTIYPILFWIGYEIPEIWINYNLRSVLQVFIVIMYVLILVGMLTHKRKAFR